MNNLVKLIEQCVQCSNEKILKINLDFIESMLNLLFNQIKKTDSVENAELIFNLLGEIQFVLAKASFKEGAPLTPQLNKFICDFDRIDDIETREFLYLRIRAK